MFEPPQPLLSDDELARARSLSQRLVEEVRRAYFGAPEVVEQLLVVLLARGHLLLEGVPGVAKTTLVKAFARTLGCGFRRIQFTPDLLPGDITGSSIFDATRATFVVRPGPLFTPVLLADEINRAPGKTQAALLEAMQERQVTIEGETRPLPSPFVVLATQNPIEQEGTYPLPEAQIDRFTARLRIGYPLPSEEREMLRRLTTSGETVQNVASVTSPDELLALQSSVDRVHVAEELVDYVLQLVGATRTHRRIALGCSPRAALQLLQAARAQALCQGRGYVLPDDLKSQARVVLPHRVVLSPDAELDGVQAEALLEELLGRIPWRAPAAAMGMPR